MTETNNPGPVPSRRAYEVGYRRPPVATRFQPGNNFSRRERRKLKKTAGQLLEEAMNAKVRITVEGKTRVMTKQEVIIHNLVNAAARGDHKAIQALFALRTRYQDSTQTAIDPTDLDASDRRIIEAFLANASEDGPAPASLSADDPRPDAAGETSNDASPNTEGGEA